MTMTQWFNARKAFTERKGHILQLIAERSVPPLYEEYRCIKCNSSLICARDEISPDRLRPRGVYGGALSQRCWIPTGSPESYWINQK